MNTTEFYFLLHKSDEFYIFFGGLIKDRLPRIYLLLPVEIDGFGR